MNIACILQNWDNNFEGVEEGSLNWVAPHNLSLLLYTVLIIDLFTAYF